MALYNGSEKFSSQIGIAQYADVTDLMKHMTVEVGDVGQVMLPLNENENKRRYLNGQAILQEQFPKFTAKLKNAVSLYPSMACTEAQWQAKRLADPDDQCAKFVIDDVNGTIRLPRIKFLCGNLNLYKIAEGIPNRRVIQKKLPTNSDRSWYVIYNDGYCEQGNNTMNIAEENHWFAFEIPFITTPHVIIGRERDSRNSVATNTDFMGRWDCSKTGFRTWGNWNGFRMSYTASGMIDLSLIKNYVKTEAENDYQFPYYIQVSTGVDYEVDVTNHITTNSPYSLGMYTRSIGNLNNLSWLKSDGTYHSGAAYPDMYNWILQNYNGVKNDGIEVGLKNNSYIWHHDVNTNFKGWTPKRTVHIGDPVYGYGWYTNNTSDIAGYITSVADNDHFSFFNVRTQSTVNLVYEGLDESNRAITDYMYVLDTANQAFRLPLSTGDEMVPDYSSNNMFDIQHFPQYIRKDNHHYFIAPCNGYAIIQIDRESTGGNTPQYSVNGVQMQYGPFWVANYINWNIPLRKGDILRVWSDLADNKFEYGKKLFVKATNMSPVYFYVGETMQDANLINVGRIVEAGAQLNTLVQLSEELGPMRTRYIVEKWENGTNGYMIYNDNYCVQYGVTDFISWTTNGNYASVSFFKEMADINYHKTATMLDHTANWPAPGCCIDSWSTTGLNVSIAAVGNNQGTARMSWRIEGYMARG